MLIMEATWERENYMCSCLFLGKSLLFYCSSFCKTVIVYSLFKEGIEPVFYEFCVHGLANVIYTTQYSLGSCMLATLT